MNASMRLIGFLPRVRLAVIRTLLDEVNRLHDEGDWQGAEAVRRQLTQELEALSGVPTRRPAAGRPAKSAKLARTSQHAVGGAR
jgi:hypothetical protein